jgi:hypothetical protein
MNASNLLLSESSVKAIETILLNTNTSEA